MAGTNRIRILHTSDWQLGMAPKFLGDEARARYSHARVEVVKKILDLAQERDCDAVVVAGDVFDNNFLKPEVYQRTLDTLEHTTVPVYLLPGNHDPYDAASIYRSSDITELNNVHVLTDSEPRYIPSRQDAADGTTGGDNSGGSTRARIVGAPMLSKHVDVDLVSQAIEQLQPPDDLSITVVVGHGATIAFGEAKPEHIDVDAADAAHQRRVVDYVALGDTHSAMPLGSHGVVWYSGAPEVTDYREPGGGGEANSGKVLIVDIEVHDPSTPASVEVDQVQVGSWVFEALAAEINSRQQAEQFIHDLQAKTDKAYTSVKYALQGIVDLDTHAWLERQLEAITPKFAALYPRDRLMSLHVRPSQEELSQEFSGNSLVSMVVEQLMERIDVGDEAASDALNLLYRLKQEQG